MLGLDTLYLSGMLAIVVHDMRTDSGLYFEAALLIGMLGFTATVALAKFLIHGEVIR
ncbi:multicomponent K+:H+ antiporter subunit F [Methylobacterium pseudosasicola]|uniref:Multicomponent K+:H+ antiporter subunit F n=1 Tax=Methylobacterium pseudosasicola TaxID=582667 RepID=A0A1I4UX67_9HYPH|nr:multicomponent K+:H+ antiporter subunit F [Methylobacterium pseudosasicola]